MRVLLKRKLSNILDTKKYFLGKINVENHKACKYCARVSRGGVRMSYDT